MFKPLLASAADLSALRFPYLATPKIDGIRCLVMAGGAVTRSLKPIPNAHIRTMLSDPSLVGMDGELLTFTNGERDDFNTVQSKVMSSEGQPDFRFIVFDRFDDPGAPYSARCASLARASCSLVDPLLPTEIADAARLDAYEAECVDSLGWEGVMLRRPDGPYKFGRSTAREGILLKVKRFTDDEAIITGMLPLRENQNEGVRNALGRTERSSAKAGRVEQDTLGAIECSWKGVTFQIGTGLTQTQRDDLWRRRGSLTGKSVTFKYQGVGSLGAPRFPVFLGIRHDLAG